MTAITPDAVVHHAVQTADGTQCVTVHLTEKSDTRVKQIVFAPPWVIPVIFVPGVMGTNLNVKDSADGETVWAPPNSKIGGLPLVFEFLFKSPKARQERFNPINAEVDWNGPLNPGAVKLNEPEGTVATLRKRGWGSVHADSYHGLLQHLHMQLNSTDLLKAVAPSAASDAALPEFWSKLEQDPKQWGSTSAQSQPASREQLRQMCRYRYDIWACGYNWLQSNLDSGKDLHAYIQKVLQTYKDSGCVSASAPPMKVIIVTHSMGGLVLRGLLQIPGAANNILGVVHGVQPAAGAPAVYKRMRAGFESIEQVVLGRDAAEAVPVLANSPALLEMLPFGSYNYGQPWLKAGGKLPVTVEYPEPPFKSDEEALAFWDAVTSTLRLRPLQGPGGQTLAPDGSPPPAAGVGEVCPQEGVWEAHLATSGPLHDWPQWVRLLKQYPSRFKEVGKGQAMPPMYVSMHPDEDARNAVLNEAVTWRWVRAVG